MFILSFKLNKDCTEKTFAEVIGMPASGKSTLVSEMEQHNPKLVNVNRKLPNSKIFRQILKLKYNIILLFKSPISFWKDTKIIISSKQNSITDLLTVLLNWHFLVCSYKKNRGKGDYLHIWDQGLFQALWSIYFSSTHEFNALELFNNKVLPQEVYFIDASDENLLERCRKRGTFIRLDYSDTEQIKKGRDSLEETIKIIKVIGYY